MLGCGGGAVNLYCWWTVPIKPGLLFSKLKDFVPVIDLVRSVYILYNLHVHIIQICTAPKLQIGSAVLARVGRGQT